MANNPNKKGLKDRSCRPEDPYALTVGDPVYVSAVDQLRGADGRNWLQGVLIGMDGVKLTVRLNDGRVVVRHVDRVRACRGPVGDRGRSEAPDLCLTSPRADSDTGPAAVGATAGVPAGPVSPVLGAAGDRPAGDPPAPHGSDRVLRARPLPAPDRLCYV